MALGVLALARQTTPAAGITIQRPLADGGEKSIPVDLSKILERMGTKV